MYQKRHSINSLYVHSELHFELLLFHQITRHNLLKSRLRLNEIHSLTNFDIVVLCDCRKPPLSCCNRRFRVLEFLASICVKFIPWYIITEAFPSINQTFFHKFNILFITSLHFIISSTMSEEISMAVENILVFHFQMDLFHKDALVV